MDCTKGYFTKTKLIYQLNHSGFMCHVTFYFYSKYTIDDINHLFDSFQIFEMEKNYGSDI